MIAEICIHLQKHVEIKNISGLFDKINSWISSKLKSDRHRSTETYKNTKKRYVERKSRKKTRYQSISSDESDSDDDTSNDIAKGKKVRLNPVGMCNNSSVSDKTENEKMPQPRPFSHLKTLLIQSKYPSQRSTNLDGIADPERVYSWFDLLDEMVWSEAKLRRIMTTDSYVIIDGKYKRLILVRSRDELLS